MITDRLQKTLQREQVEIDRLRQQYDTRSEAKCSTRLEFERLREIQLRRLRRFIRTKRKEGRL